MDDARVPMLDQDRLNSALKALGRIDDPNAEECSDPRVVALGSLLMLAELSAMSDVDRLEQESLQQGAQSVAYDLATNNFGLSGDRAAQVALQMVLQVQVDRLRRTQLELASLTDSEPHGWTVAPAVDALLSATLVLLTAENRFQSTRKNVDAEVKAGHALLDAVKHAQTAANLIIDGLTGRQM